MANEFTLYDYQRIAPNPLTAAVVRTWRENSPVMDMLTFRTSTNLTEKVLRYNTVNSPTWRKIGETFTQSKVVPEPIEERLYFMGNKIDVPYEYVKATGALTNPRADQTEAVLKAMSIGFSTAFFRGTPTSDEDSIVGMWYRIINDLGSAQYFDAALDVSPDTALSSAALVHQTLDAVDNLLSLVDGNPGDKVLFMGHTMHRRFQSILRQSNLLSTTTDQIGRQFLTYGQGGAKIVDVGYQADQSTSILTDVETSNTALTGGTKSSMYCLRFGAPYIAGWCQEMPTAEDKGMTEDGTNYRTIVRFSPGLFMTSPRSAALAYGFQAA